MDTLNYINGIIYVNKMDNFMDKYNLPKLNQDQVNNLYIPITCKEIETIIKSFPTKRRFELDGFSAEFYKNFKEKLIPILLKLFYILETKGTSLKSFYVATVTLILKPLKDTIKKEHLCKDNEEALLTNHL